jgi:hypothetical protein
MLLCEEPMIEYKRTMVKIPKELHDSMRRMCILTNCNMTQFIKSSIESKIKELKSSYK